MHAFATLAIWFLVSFVVWTFSSYIYDSHRHVIIAQQLGCLPAHSITHIDPLGILSLIKVLRAVKEQRIPQYIKGLVDDACAREGKALSTFYQHIKGVDTNMRYMTVEPKNIQAILATQFDDFGLGERRNEIFYPLLGWGIFTTDGQKWKRSRALLKPQFSRDQVSDLELEETHVQNMMHVIPVDESGWTSITNLKDLFFRLTIDSATEFLTGESIDSQLSSLPGYVSNKPPMPVSEQDFAVSLDRAQATVAMAARLGDLFWILFNKTFKNHCDRCHKFIDHHVQLALSQERTSPETTTNGKPKYVFLDALVESTRDPIELRSQMISVLFAGRDSTASLLSYVFMVFAQYPPVYSKVRALALEEFGTYKKPKNLSFSSLKNCKYLQWVLKETLRLYPIVPVNSRRALRDTTLPSGGGPDGTAPVYIRKGEQVDYSVYVMQRRKDLWGFDAEEFRPERWDGRKVGFEYLPFNGGPRICIGQQFALTEAAYVIVRLAQRFEKMEGVGNTWESREKGGMGYVRHALTLLSCPADGVKMRMKEAQEA